MFLQEKTEMDRKQFVHKAGRWGLIIVLGGITASLARKIVLKKDCSACPEYASCPGVELCSIPSVTKK